MYFQSILTFNFLFLLALFLFSFFTHLPLAALRLGERLFLPSKRDEATPGSRLACHKRFLHPHLRLASAFTVMVTMGFTRWGW